MAKDLESLRASFNRSLRVEGKADRTLVLYGQSITYFSAWLAQRSQPADVSNLDRDTVLYWLDSLRHRGLTTGTIRTRWRGLRRFTNWLLAEGIIDTDPLAGIVIDKPEPPPVPVLTDDELAALIGACRGKSFRGRNRATSAAPSRVATLPPRLRTRARMLRAATSTTTTTRRKAPTTARDCVTWRGRPICRPSNTCSHPGGQAAASDNACGRRCD